MKLNRFTSVMVTAICLSLSAPLLAQSSINQGQQDSSIQQPSGKQQAMRMVAARTALMHRLDAKKVKPGYVFYAKLVQKIHLHDGTILPSGTMLKGTIEKDDMQVQGMSKLVLRFESARLKSGRVIPIKATIVGIHGPESADTEAYPMGAGDEVPNSWTDGTLQEDIIGAMPGVDLHSKIASKNSGVFVSKTKDNVTLAPGTELLLALGSGTSQ